MDRRTVTTFLVLLALVAGCTPQSEIVIKKQKLGASAERIPGGEGAVIDEGRQTDLDPATLSIIQSYGPTIRKYADTYGFDWRLILAVMKQESQFSRDAESEKGATGFMQIMPVTGEEVAKSLEIKDISQPMNNIRGGVFYLRKLYNLFEGANEADRIKLTLAAYNAGIGRVYDAQDVAAYLDDKPGSWQAIKDALPLLSKRYYTLHRSVWDADKPRNGWFGGARQTIAYVERIMDYYDEYRVSLN